MKISIYVDQYEICNSMHEKLLCVTIDNMKFDCLQAMQKGEPKASCIAETPQFHEYGAMI